MLEFSIIYDIRIPFVQTRRGFLSSECYFKEGYLGYICPPAKYVRPTIVYAQLMYTPFIILYKGNTYNILPTNVFTRARAFSVHVHPSVSRVLYIICI